MTQIGLLLFLLTAPQLDRDQLSSPGAQRLEHVTIDPCAEAERIAAQPPCLRAEDCGALRSWKRLFGAPRVEPLDPRLAVRASRTDVPASYLCPARAGSRLERPAPPLKP